jgi:hypothetical protein
MTVAGNVLGELYSKGENTVIRSLSILCLGLSVNANAGGDAVQSMTGVSAFRSENQEHHAPPTKPALTAWDNDRQSDVDRLIALRSHSLDDVLALAEQLEAKWRLRDWNSYASIMMYVCSEIQNRGLNNERVIDQSEHFARLALLLIDPLG